MNLELAAGVGGFVTLGDTTYQCTPLTLEDFGLAQAYLKSKTPDPMEGIAEMCKDLHVEVAKVLVKEAFAARQKWGSLESPEGLKWASSADGLAFFIFRQTRKHHHEVTLEELKIKCNELEHQVISSVMKQLAEISGLIQDPQPRSRRKPVAKPKKK